MDLTPQRAFAVEAETISDDLQALERRIALKRRDGGIDHLILVIADTRRNRRAIAAGSVAFAGGSGNPRAVLAVLRAGRDPSTGGLLLR